MDKVYDVMCLGMMVMDVLARPVDDGILNRDVTIADSIGISTGGDAMTQSIIAARLGCRTALVGKVGMDMAGNFLMESMEKSGVDTRYIKWDPEVDTCISMGLVRADGQRNFVTSPGLNNATLSVNDFDPAVFGQAKVLGYGSMMFMRDLDPDAAGKVFRVARAQGVKTVVDLCADINGFGARAVLDSLSEIDYFLPSLEEAGYVSGLNDPEEMAALFLEHGCGNVVIKLGGEGCYVRNRDIAQVFPAFRVEVVDTTGAGDNFVAGFLCALAHDEPILEAVRFGSAVSAVSIGQLGSTTAVRDRRQVMELLGHEYEW